jgi:hypothetical protein
MIQTKNIRMGDAAAESLIMAGSFALADALLDRLYLTGISKVEVMGVSAIMQGYTGGTTPTLQFIMRWFDDSVDGMALAGGTDVNLGAAFDPENGNYSLEIRNLDGSPLATINGVAHVDDTTFVRGLGLKFAVLEGGTLAGGTGHAKAFLRLYREQA